MTDRLLDKIASRVKSGERVWLFMDYDGTLADFAPTPDIINMDAGLVELLSRLAQRSNLRVAVISGRSLETLRQLLPARGIFLGGTYGLEMVTHDGQEIRLADAAEMRPGLEEVKKRWQALIGGRQGFYLEDKGLSVALHARFVPTAEADPILETARQEAAAQGMYGSLRLYGGHKFLEVGSHLADKGEAVRYLWQHYPWISALPIFIGDDDKDERAFATVRELGGLAVVVAAEERSTQANTRVDSYRDVREWLRGLVE